MESPLVRAERLEGELGEAFRVIESQQKELEDAKRRCEELEIACESIAKDLKQRTTSNETLHERFVAVENQLTESRRNFAIIAKLLRGTE